MSERLERPSRPTLDQKISAALGNGKVAVDDLQTLLPQIEDGIRQSDRIAEQERARSLDPSTAPHDAEAAQRAADVAVLTCRRLAAALVRLREKLKVALREENHERWVARYQRHHAECNALAKEFTDTYPTLTKQLVELLQRVAACDRESAAINGDAPDDEHKRLGKVELLARQLQQFSQSQPSIIATLTLPDWTQSSGNLWPPPQPSFAEIYAQSMAVAPHPGADWAKAQAARAEAIRAEQQRQAEFMERMTREQEERQNAEERARFGRQA
jgi:hypothetical protein